MNVHITDISYTKNNGEIVDRDYVRCRVVSKCGAKVAQLTVDNNDWMRGRNGMLASAIVRDASRDSWILLAEAV
jgi:hypothetical protein